ncbi:(Fe-S)-binding protein, partial [Nitratidesulfovibrio liaohensis]|uniref:(Fe-S)-binding protein n=1 Tax=Nitratidesulfovibrio liaohensis TaxID=2604158 RepID=UPI002444B8EB
ATFGGVGAEGLPRFDSSSVDALAELVAERGFVLPGLDCGACGQQDCAGFARMVVAHQAVPDDCCSVDGPLSVTVNGHQLGLNPFVARIVSGSLKGMLAELKGYSPGAEVVIRLAE